MLQPEHLRTVNAQATPRRAISVGLVVLFHVAVIYAFASGLANRFVEKLPEDFIAKVEPPKLPDIKPPPPPPPDLEKPPPPFVPPPDIVIETPTTNTNAITVVHTVAVPPPPKPTGITAPALIANGRANCATNYYPPIAVRLNQEGVTTVMLHIGADGSVQSAEVSNSSGHDSLDQASVKCVTSGAWRFHPAMENGQPVPTTRQYNIKWQLQG